MNARPIRLVFCLAGLVFLDRGLGAATLRVPGEFASIQSAIAVAAQGDTILVAAGTYRERLILREGLILRSEGDDRRGAIGLWRAEATILDGRGGRGPGVTMAAGATLDGFTVTGVGSYDDKLWQHHHDTQGREQSHEHIGQPGDAGIAVGTDCLVQHNIVHHIGSTGIAIQGSVAPLILGNVCHRNMGGGIGAMDGTTARIEANVCFENFHAGIGCRAASPLLKDNVCHGNIRGGIGISEGSSPSVTGNRCFSNRRAGIGIRTGADTRPVVEDNSCTNNAMAGIGVEEGARPRLVRNRVHGNALPAIAVTGGAEAWIEGNDLARDGGTPPLLVVLGDSRAVITGNRLRGGGVAGIMVKGRAEIRNNHFVGNGPTAKPPANQAVWAQSGAEVHCSGNRIEGWKQVLTQAQDAKVTAVDNAWVGYSR